MTTLRWGIISTGRIAGCFIRDMLVDPKTRDVTDVVHKVTAVGSRSVESAQKFIDAEAGDKASGIKAYGSYAEVFADSDVDAVYIGTPHTLHYGNAVDALKAGKHVLVEKPATSNAAEWRELCKLAAEKKVFLMEAMWTRFQPVARAIRTLIDGGSLGRPVVVDADFSVDFDVDNLPLTHRMMDPKLGGGAILDLGPYPLIWAILALYEDPANDKSIQPEIAASIIKTPQTGVDMNTSFALSFPTIPAQARLSCAMNVPGRTPAALIRFRAGTIEIPGPPYAPKSYTVRYFDKKDEDKVIKEETHDVDWVGGGWHFQADEVARGVRDGKLESSLWGHDKTTLAMTIFDEVRRQGDYKLPDGVEKVV